MADGEGKLDSTPMGTWPEGGWIRLIDATDVPATAPVGWLEAEGEPPILLRMSQILDLRDRCYVGHLSMTQLLERTLQSLTEIANRKPVKFQGIEVALWVRVLSLLLDIDDKRATGGQG